MEFCVQFVGKNSMSVVAVLQVMILFVLLIRQLYLMPIVGQASAFCDCGISFKVPSIDESIAHENVNSEVFMSAVRERIASLYDR